MLWLPKLTKWQCIEEHHRFFGCELHSIAHFLKPQKMYTPAMLYYLPPLFYLPPPPYEKYLITLCAYLPTLGCKIIFAPAHLLYLPWLLASWGILWQWANSGDPFTKRAAGMNLMSIF